MTEILMKRALNRKLSTPSPPPLVTHTNIQARSKVPFLTFLNTNNYTVAHVHMKLHSQQDTCSLQRKLDCGKVYFMEKYLHLRTLFLSADSLDKPQREREREGDREGDRQTNRQTDRQKLKFVPIKSIMQTDSLDKR